MTSPEGPLVSPAVLPPGFDDPAIPRIAVEPVESCPLCGSRDWHPFADGYDYERRTCRNRWHFVACAYCDHVRLHPRPRADTVDIISPPRTHPESEESAGALLARWTRAWLEGRRITGILSHRSPPPTSYLDIGCGQGRRLDLMASRGLQPARLYGLGLDPAAIEKLREKGYQASVERVEDCRGIPAGGIDLATMFHIIEHVARPDAVIRQVAQWLAPGGVLAMTTLNLDSWDARRFRKRFWGGYHIPRNWHLFTPDTITKLLAAAGLDVVAVEYQVGPSVWLYSCHHRLRYDLPPHPRLAGPFSPRGGSRLVQAAATAIDMLRVACGGSTSSMLVIARNPV